MIRCESFAPNYNVNLDVWPCFGLNYPGYEDLCGAHLSTKFGVHQIILTPSYRPHKFNSFTVHLNDCTLNPIIWPIWV